jgi:phosphomannomutase
MSELLSKKVFIFDLDDTLALSKQPLASEMSDLLEELISKGYLIAVTSGGSYEQFKHQFLGSLGFMPSHFENLFIMPTSGASLYKYNLGKWLKIYSHDLETEEKMRIIQALERAVREKGYWIENSAGPLIEDRGTQISYSGLGQNATIKDKKIWDQNQEKRKEIIASLKEELHEFDIKMGGMTTIDITKRGINKALGIKELSKLLNIPISDMVFIGDALYPGGNDETARESGIDCVAVTGVEDTKKLIKEVLQQS